MQRSVPALVAFVMILSAAACSAPAARAVPASPTSESPSAVIPSAEPRTTPPLADGPTLTDTPIELTTAASPVPASPLPLDGPLSEPASVTVRTYFMLDGEPGSAGFVPVLRDMPMSDSTEAAAVAALLAGPSASEMQASPRVFTWIPGGTRLLGLTDRDGVATVDLSREFAAPGDRPSALGRLGQVVYTLTVYPWVTAVHFRVEGQPLEAMADGAVMPPGPVARGTDPWQYEGIFDSLVPTVFVDGPSWGETLYGSSVVEGTAAAAGDRFRVELLDAAGQQLTEAFGADPCAGPCRGGFEARIDFHVDEPQWGTLRVTAINSTGASVGPAREYPVWLLSVDSSDGGRCGC